MGIGKFEKLLSSKASPVLHTKKFTANDGDGNRDQGLEFRNKASSSSSVPTESSNSQQREFTQANIGQSKFKQGRGKTRGLKLAKKKRKGEKLDVLIPINSMRMVGSNAQLATTEVGVVVRQIAPLNVDKWSNIDAIERGKMMAHIKGSFNIEKQDHADIAIESTMRNLYRGYRYRLHKHFMKHSTLQEAIANRPVDVEELEWKSLIELFTSPNFLKRSAINKRNRAQQRTSHCARTKSFARISYDMRNKETEVELNTLDMWFETHYNKKKKSWVDEKSKEIYEEVAELLEETQCVDEEPKSVDELFERVHPTKCGKSKFTIVSEQFRQEAREASKRAESAERKNEELILRIHMLESRQASIETCFMERIKEEVQAGIAAIKRDMSQGYDIDSGVSERN